MAIMSIGQENGAQGPPPGPPQGRGQGRPQGPPQGRPQGPPQGAPQMRGRGGPPPPIRGPPPGGRGGYPNSDMQRQDSGHFESNMRGQGPSNRAHPDQRPRPSFEGARGPPQQRPYNPNAVSPTQQAFGPNTQRAMTLPQNMPSAENGRGYNPQQQQQPQQQWMEPGPVAGYHGPESPPYIPPRPTTAGGTKPNSYGRPLQNAQAPPMPYAPPAQQQQQYQRYDEGPQDLNNVYDDYYGGEPLDRKSTAASIDMPNFDAIPDTGGKHRRGFSIENHLSPTAPGPPFQALPPPGAVAAQQGDFRSQSLKSRSQPDLHEQYAQGTGVYEMAVDAPAVPALPITNGNGLPSGPRGRGPPSRGMTLDNVPVRGPPNQAYGAGQPQNFDPRYGPQHPPMPRGYSNETTYSEPGPHVMRSVSSPMAPGNPIRRPGTAGPAPGRMPSDPVRRAGTAQPQKPVNPDALPAHPVPVRPGLMQQQPQGQTGQAARPPPVRQYHTDPSPVGHTNQPASSVPPQRPVSVIHPVTHDELNRLRNIWKANPADSTTGLLLAKKLVEAATVLADEGGTADNRARNKNREKFVMEAHKTVKKLISGNSADAMFYMADCYGQGLLGLQVDTKEAFTLYQSAAKAGHPASAYRTAVCCEMGHEEGGGTKKDPLKAVQWYRRAAALGDVPAMYKVGMILLKGLLGQQKNLGEAINMLKRAADRADAANPHALHELALLYEAQTGNEKIIRDEPYALSLFRQAAELDYKFSQFRMGQAYEYGLLGCQIDGRTSLAWYTRAAAQEEHQSELALSGWYLTGSAGILEQSDTEAYLWARKAACAEPPLPKALFAMGYFTEVGIGCPRSLEEAKRWYGRAAGKFCFPLSLYYDDNGTINLGYELTINSIQISQSAREARGVEEGRRESADEAREAE
jgi:TPR repeat protein